VRGDNDHDPATVVTTILLVAGALFAVGYFPARVVVRDPFVSALLAPITAAIVISIPATLCVLVRASLGFAIGAAVLTAFASAWYLVRERAIWPGTTSPLLLVLPVVVALPFATIRLAPTAYDANVIWWFHARWFAGGGAAVADALTNSAFAFSHPDYPPLTAATTGALWWVTGATSLRVAQATTAILTLSAICALAAVIWRIAVAVRTMGAATAVATVVALATVGVANEVPGAPATNGYVDVLAAALVAAGAAALLGSPERPSNLALGAICIAGACLTKNEAAFAAGAIVVLAIARSRDRWRAALWLGAALAPGLLWQVTARGLGASSDYQEGSRLGDLLTVQPGATERFGETTRAIWDQTWPLLIVGAAALALGLLFARNERSRLTGSSFPWLWLGLGVIAFEIWLGFVTSPNDDLAGHLGSAVDRLCIVLNLVLLVEITIWGLTAWQSLAVSGPRSSAYAPTGE
jgi:hypothetical protein